MKRSRVPSLSAGISVSSTDTSLSSSVHHVPKYAALDAAASSTTIMRCSLPPHPPQDFPDAASYELHYLSEHSHRCSECQHNFPSTYLLDLHIAEYHDPIIEARRDSGEKTYACFVETCEKVCIDWKKRRSHLIDKHSFPRNYDFFIVRTGIDGRRSLLRAGIDDQGHRRSSRERSALKPEASDEDHMSVLSEALQDSEHKGDATNPLESANRAASRVSLEQKQSGLDEAINDLTSNLSSLRMVPRSVRFGRGRGRVGLAGK